MSESPTGPDKSPANSAINSDVSLQRPDNLSAEEAAMYDNFEIGGSERQLNPRERLEQLTSYLQAHYDCPAAWQYEACETPGSDQDVSNARAEIESYLSRLPDRITHAGMLMLGSGVDHSLPFQHWVRTVDDRESPYGRAYLSEGNQQWVIAVHGGWFYGGAARQMLWEPDVAAAAQVSGCSILFVDYPLRPKASREEVKSVVKQAVEHIRQQHPTAPISGWGRLAGADIVLDLAELFDSLIMTFPNTPDSAQLGDSQLPPALVQLAAAEQTIDTDLAQQVTVEELCAFRHVATADVYRTMVQSVADFLNAE